MYWSPKLNGKAASLVSEKSLTYVTLLRALRPDIGGWVTLSPRYWAGVPSDGGGGAGLPPRGFSLRTEVGLPSLLTVYHDSARGYALRQRQVNGESLKW